MLEDLQSVLSYQLTFAEFIGLSIIMVFFLPWIASRSVRRRSNVCVTWAC